MSIAGEFGAGTPGGTAYSNTIGANVANGGMVPLKKDASGNPTSLVDGDGNAFLRGAVASGEWMTPPSIFRLRLTGTGTATMDARDSLGNITSAVAVFTANGATDQIEFPYAGDNAVAIRFTLTGSVTVEVI